MLSSIIQPKALENARRFSATSSASSVSGRKSLKSPVMLARRSNPGTSKNTTVVELGRDGNKKSTAKGTGFDWTLWSLIAFSCSLIFFSEDDKPVKTILLTSNYADSDESEIAADVEITRKKTMTLGGGVSTSKDKITSSTTPGSSKIVTLTYQPTSSSDDDSDVELPKKSGVSLEDRQKQRVSPSTLEVSSTTADVDDGVAANPNQEAVTIIGSNCGRAIDETAFTLYVTGDRERT